MVFFRALAAGVAASVIGTVVVVVGGGVWAGGFGVKDFGWFISVSVLPSTAVALIIALMRVRMRTTPVAMWSIAVAAAFLAVTVAGSVAAPIAQSLQFGRQNTNVGGYVRWAPIYAIILLPISAPIAYAVVNWLWRPRSQARSRNASL